MVDAVRRRQLANIGLGEYAFENVAVGAEINVHVGVDGFSGASVNTEEPATPEIFAEIRQLGGIADPPEIFRVNEWMAAQIIEVRRIGGLRRTVNVQAGVFADKPRQIGI